MAEADAMGPELCSSFDDAWHRAAVEFADTQLSEVVTVDEVVAVLGHTKEA